LATAVFFHAHPDDETLFTGGTMARAASQGHRVVLVTATRGERGHDHGEVLRPGEGLGSRRALELGEASRLLGVARSEWLGYADSGSQAEPGPAGAGRPQPEAPDLVPFSHVPVAEAAGRLADILAEERPEILTTYDDRGGYGHPDHIQAHRVATLAARLTADQPTVLWATFDRDRIRHLLDLAGQFGLEVDADIRVWSEQLGVPADRISSTVDVAGWIDHKRRAMAAHASQFPSSSWFMTLPSPAFQLLFGTEWYIQPGAPAGRSWLFES
jgi:LmbE family N-acetylglucosaminyl deacetylase